MTMLPFRSSSDVDFAFPVVAAHLSMGGLIAYPTETVYGMGSRMTREDLTTLARLTQRPAGKPFLMLIAGRDMVRECGLMFNEAAEVLAERYWPGPLTLVVDCADPTHPETLGDRSKGVAVRWSSHEHTSRLVELMGIPISSTSANVSGRKPLPNASAIAAEFEESVSAEELLLLDGDALGGSLPSTLVDCMSPEPRVLREGAISRSEIALCLQKEAG